MCIRQCISEACADPADRLRIGRGGEETTVGSGIGGDDGADGWPCGDAVEGLDEVASAAAVGGNGGEFIEDAGERCAAETTACEPSEAAFSESCSEYRGTMWYVEVERAKDVRRGFRW